MTQDPTTGEAKRSICPVRLRLLSLIACHDSGEACVCDLTSAFEQTTPTISHHLKVLKHAGLIDSERRGTWVYYWINPGVLARLSALLGSRQGAGMVRRDRPGQAGVRSGGPRPRRWSRDCRGGRTGSCRCHEGVLSRAARADAIHHLRAIPRGLLRPADWVPATADVHSCYQETPRKGARVAEEARPGSEETTIHVGPSGLTINLPAGYAKHVTPGDDVTGHEFEEEDVEERMFHVNVGCCSVN